MSVIEYPSTLPCPRVSVVTPAERRLLSNAERPLTASTLSRDRRQFESITFPTMNAAQAEEFLAWWEDTLLHGALWFVAAWPIPIGAVRSVRKFVTKLRWNFVPGGFWSITAFTEVRGRGEEPSLDPLPLILMHLDGDSVDEMGATYSPPTGTISPTFSTSAAGFGQQATFASGSRAVRSVYSSTERFFDVDEWQVDAFVIIDQVSGLARTVCEFSGFGPYNDQDRILWVRLSQATGAVALDVDIRVGPAEVESLQELSAESTWTTITDRHHVRVAQYDGAVHAFIDGVMVSQFPDTVSVTGVSQTGTQVTVGAVLAGSSSGDEVYSAFMRGSIDEFRFCQEVTDRGNFTPPTRPFTIPAGS